MPSRVVRHIAFFGLLAAFSALVLGGCLFFPRRTTVTGNPSLPGKIEGLIVDGQGRALAGAKASIPEIGEMVAVSGADGKVSFTGLAPGVYYVQVSKEQYLNGNFEVQLTGTAPAQFQGWLLLSAGNLHLGNVPNLCADCHVLHDPTPSDHLMKGNAKNDACFACHTPSLNHGFSRPIYDNSPHGTSSAVNSNTQVAWTKQPAADRGLCSTCHEPHGTTGPPSMLQKGSVAGGTVSLNNLCLECHSLAGAQGTHTDGWPGKDAYLNATTNKHADFTDSSLPKTYAKGDCGICHVPHGQSFDGGTTNDPAMTRRKGNLLCTSAGCHPTKAGPETGHGNCVMCHDPHDTGTATHTKVKDPVTGARFTITKENYRTQSLIPNFYCLGCHREPPPAGYTTAKEPYTETRFTNAQVKPDTSLHRVHVSKVRIDLPNRTPFGDRSYDHGGWPYRGDVNNVRCVMCHSPHASTQGYNLLTGVIVSHTRGGSGYNGKAGCSVGATCHTCDYCHGPKNNGTSQIGPGGPAVDCSYCSEHRSFSAYHGIEY